MVDSALVSATIARLKNCRVHLYAGDGCGCTEVRARLCKSCVCPMCSAWRADERTRRYAWVASQLMNPRLLTLTIPRVRLGKLAHGRRALLKAFQDLRRTKVFSDVRGGIWATETVPKWNGHNLHLHALIDGRVENRNSHGRPLETTWARLTASLGNGDNERRVVDVRKADPDGIREVFKYAVKGVACDPKRWNGKGDPAQYAEGFPSLSEILTAFHGQKAYDVWGNLRELHAESVQRDEDQRAETESPIDLVEFSDDERAFVCTLHGNRMECVTDLEYAKRAEAGRAEAKRHLARLAKSKQT